MIRSSRPRATSCILRWTFAPVLAIGFSLLTSPGLAQAASPPAAPPAANPTVPDLAAGKAPAAPAKKTAAARPVELDADRKPVIVTGGNCFIHNGTLLTVTRGIIQKGDILVKSGKIVAIGANLVPPAGITVIDATGKFVTPGLVDAHSHIALDAVNEGSDSITAEVDMHDVVNPDSLSLYRGLSNGVTASLLLHGSANSIGGQSVVVKMKYKQPVAELFVPDAPRMIKFALGENVTQANFRPNGAPRYPTSRLGVESVYRRAFAEARRYMDRWDRYEKEKQSDPNAIPPRQDLRLDALADILRGKLWVQCHSYRQDEMLMMVRLSQEFHFRLTLQHALEAYRITPEIRAAGVGVSTFADAWAYKVEANNAIPYNAAICVRAGIVTSVNSDNSEGTYRLNIEAANCMKYGGLTQDEALKLVTINPAIQLGIDRRAGSLEVGKDADIVVWSGYPLSVYSKCSLTMVEGEVYYQRGDPFHLESRAVIHDTVGSCPTDHQNLPLPPRHSAYAIVGGTVHPVSAPDIPNGMVVIEDGKIKAVGQHLPVPSGAYVVQARGLQVYPGMIDAGSSLGLSEIDSISASRDVGEAGEYEPDLRALTAVNPGSEHIPIARNNGITATMACPSGGVISGQASVIDLDGWTGEQMSVRPTAALRINFPEPPRNLERFAEFLPPDAIQQMKERATAQTKLIRDFFDRAQHYALVRTQAPDTVALDPKMEAMIPYVTGKQPVVFDVSTAAGIRAALKFADDYKLKPILSGGADAWKVADLIASKHVPYLFHTQNANSLEDDPPLDDYDPTDSPLAAPALLQRAGVTLCFESQDAPLAKNLPRQVGILCAYGLPHDEAIRCLTLNAAQTLGVADRMGSLEAGKLANVIVTDGDPLEVTTHLHYLFIAGKPLPLIDKHSELYRLYRQRLSEIPTTTAAVASSRHTATH